MLSVAEASHNRRQIEPAHALQWQRHPLSSQQATSPTVASSRQARFPDGRPSPKTGIRNGNYPRTDVSGGPVRLGRRGWRDARADRATTPPTLQTRAPHTYESSHRRAVGTPAHPARPTVGRYHYNPTYKGATPR